MANVDAPHGLRPLMYLNGAPYNGQARKYAVASDYGTALFIGDPVDLAGTTDATGKWPTVEKPTLADGNYTIGPIVACEPNRDDLSKVYIPATTGGYVWVADDPNIIFSVQCDSVATTEIADFGLNAILIETHAGNTSTGISGLELDESSLTGDASNMLMMLRLVDREDNELAINADVEVLISAHRYLNELGGRLGT